MRRYTISQIAEFVRIEYDEQSNSNEDMIVCPDDFDMDAVISSNVVPAYVFTMTSANISMLEGKQAENAKDLVIDENLVGHLPLPDDFLRIITARLSSWSSSASEFIEENSPEYRMQSDPYACGTFQYPVVALTHTVNGKELEFYKAKNKQDTLRSLVYIPSLSEDAINDVDAIPIPDQLVEPFIYYIAALTATTFREDVANDLFKVAKSLLGKE